MRSPEAGPVPTLKSRRMVAGLARLVFVFLYGVAPAEAQPFPAVVIPINANDASSTVPFSGGAESAGRFQQVYGAAGFTQIAGNQPFLISVIWFREDEANSKGFVSEFPDFQISLSTTPKAVDDLSPVFADNVGPDDKVIVPRGAFRISGAPDFSPDIRFASDPFYYDPSQGNLLLDIRNFGGGTTRWSVPPFSDPSLRAFVDASRVANDPVSSVYANLVDAMSGVSSTLGLVTEFTVTRVPEPSTIALISTSLVCALCICNRKLKAR